MADKNFRVKTGLQVPGVTSANFLSTDSNGTVAAGTTLPIANGGTGQTSANNALNALLPIQSGSTVNYALESDGTNTSWQKLYNQTIQNNGVTVTPRGILNIVGGNFTDSSGSDTTTLTLVSSISTKIADYTLTTSDVNKIIEFNSSSDLNLTLPTYSSAAFTYGSSFSVVNRGSGKVNILNQSGTSPLSSYSTTGLGSATYSVFYSNNVYIAQSVSSYYRSSDAITWTLISGFSTTGANANSQKIAYGNGLFVITASTGIWTSSDAITWTQRLTSGAINAIKYANGKFIAGGVNGILYTSTNGTSWTSLGQVTVSNTTEIRYIEYLNSNTWIVSTNVLSNCLKSIDNGQTWSSLTFPASSLSLATDGTKILAINSGSSTYVFYFSLDGGSTWTSRSFGGSIAYPTAPYYDGSNIYIAYTYSGSLYLSFLDGTNNLSAQSTLSGGSSSIKDMTNSASGGYLIFGPTGIAYSAGPAVTSYISKNNGSYIPASGRAEIYNYNQNQFVVSGDLGNASSISSNVTLAVNNKYFVDTTAARTLTLPASPSLGDEIYIFDATGTAFTNNITVSRNGNKINGISDDAIIDINGASTILTYTGSTYGWRFE